MQKKIALQLGVTVAAAIALVFLSVPLFKKAGNAKRPVVSHAASEPSPKKGPLKLDSPEQTIKLRYIKDDKFYRRLSRVAGVLPLDRDPFSFAYTGPKGSRDGLELVGILWEGGKPTAIINQAFLSVGNSTDQFSVIRILQDRVVLRDRTGEFELHLKQ